MKKSLGILIISLFLTGCTEFLFRNPVPGSAGAVKTVPGPFRGTFRCVEDSTILVNTETCYIRKDKTGGIQDSGCLGTDALLIPYKDQYFFNQKKTGEGGELLWRVAQVKTTADGFILCFPLADDSDSLAGVIGKYTPVEKVLKEDGDVDYYILDPDFTAFGKMVKQQVFNTCLQYKRVTD